MTTFMTNFRSILVRLIVLCAVAVQPACAATPPNQSGTAMLMTEKQVFTTTQFETYGGEIIPEVKVGWESYGKLNDAKDNVILITHYFSGNSHAAGRYHEDDEEPGYWDAIIGPGKAIDTNKFFVISVDSLVNLSAYDPNVVTTGPATINPETGKPYGLSFPVVTIRDFVNVQKLVLESLGISSLHAVAGPSMGSMQAQEWAATYPDWVPRMVAVIPAAQADAWTTAALEQWALPVRLDKHWNNGDYTRDNPPKDGLVAALMSITLQALHPDFFNQQGKALDYTPQEKDPLEDIHATHSIINWLRSRAEDRADLMDANHLLYLVRANQLFVAGYRGSLQEGLKNVKAKTLYLPAETDLLLMPYMAESPHGILKSQGKNTQLSYLKGALGHLEGVADIKQKAQLLRRFLNDETE